MESSDFPRVVKQKGLPFRDSKFSVDFSAERHAFLQFCRTTFGKSEFSADYPVESFSVLWKVIISLFKSLSLLLKLISDKNLTLGDQYYPRLVRQIIKNMC